MVLIAPRIQRLSAFPALMFFGTIITITQKYLYQQTSYSLDLIDPKPFHKPWFQTFILFLGMCLALITHEATRLIAKISVDTEALNRKLEINSIEERKNRWIFYVSALMPALTGLFYIVFQNISLIHISASVWSAFRSSIGIFYPIFNLIFFKNPQPKNIRKQILLMIISLILIGISTILNNFNSKTYIFLGLFLIIISQIIRSMHLLLETYYFEDIESTPSLVIGMEGYWGLLLIIGIFFPALQSNYGKEGTGLYENLFDTLTMLFNNSNLFSLEIMMLFLYCFDSLASMTTTTPAPELRPVVDCVQAISIWVCQIAIRISSSSINEGEEFNKYSWLQLIGEILLIISAILYMKIMNPFPNNELTEESMIDQE